MVVLLQNLSHIKQNNVNAMRNKSEKEIKELIKQAKRGDLTAFSELYEINFSSIYRYAFSKVRNKHYAEDIASHTFLKMIDSIENFSWREIPFKAWLIKIAHNLSIDHFRRMSKETENNIFHSEKLDNIEDKVINGVLFEKVLKVLDALDKKYKNVILLRFIAGLSCKETAAFMKVSEDNVRTIQHRALKMIRDEL